MLSSMHAAEIVNTQKKHRNGKDIIKPQYVLSYNNGMSGVDRSDQQASIYQCVRKSVKWYKKLFFYVLDMCVVNSYFLYIELNWSKAHAALFLVKICGSSI